MSTFNTGDRVTTVTDDDYNGQSGTVEEVFTSCNGLVDYTVLLDGKKNALSFCADELRPAPLPANIRLIVKTPAYVEAEDNGDGEYGLCDVYRYEFTGDFTVEVEEVPATVYVQVAYGPGPYGPYTYVDPSGTLAVGDEVIVPVSFGEKPGKVVALGRGSWQGECKTVTCRVVREPLA